VRYQRNQPDVNLGKYIKLLLNCASRVEQKDSIEGLMGIEGTSARGFFEAYSKLIKKEFEFKQRAYHPPPDPVNAMLSFGYMLLFNELSGLLEACGFDIYIGFLHSITYGRASLANDLMEELRSPVINRLVLYLINKGIIKQTAFTSGQKGVLMNDSARNAFLANYENFMTASFLNIKTKKRTNYRKILQQRVYEIEKAVLNNYDYTPFVLYT